MRTPVLVPHRPVEIIATALDLPDGTAIVVVATLVMSYVVSQLTHRVAEVGDA